MFLDRVKIWVGGGAGGDGAATFRREAHVPRGGPDGGDGGRGGTVHLRVDPGETTLRDYQHRHHFRAEAGGRGEGARRHGKAGSDVTLVVPPGTGVFDDASGALLADLVARDQTMMVARGGRGGLGNVHFTTSTHQAPRHAQKGEPGEERWIRLELRLIADVGLVGLPNAGKSTLLAALTAARPKIADYPFTTLEPNLGVMDLGCRRRAPPDDRRRARADRGREQRRRPRPRVPAPHREDAAPRPCRRRSEQRPEWEFEVIRDELAAHDPALLEKPMLVAFNKIDLPAAQEAWPAFRRARERDELAVVAISAAEGDGIPALRDRLAALLPSADELAEPPEPAGIVVHRLESAGSAFKVLAEAGAFRVRGRRIERLASQTNFDVEESAQRFQRDLERLGVDDALRRAGVQPGDTVRFGAVELEWEAEPWEVG